MFSGIVEASGEIIAFEAHDQSAQVELKIPSNFNDLQIGDSLSVNGVCLTIEKILPQSVSLTLGPETLKITRWSKTNISKRPVNLERSLSASARVHGHFVSGHVDAIGEVVSVKPLGECLELIVSFPEHLSRYLWQKGSVTLNGVSLTINQIEGGQLSVCLIPETLRRTNLSFLKVHDFVTIEVDAVARAIVRQLELKNGAEL